MRHRLLAIDVFAGGTGILKDLEMVVIHGGDQDGVDVFAVENRTIVAGGGDAWIVYGFARSRVTAVVEIAYRDALNARNRERCLKVLASANAGADRGEAHGVAGRNRARGGIEDVGLQNGFSDGGGDESAGTDLHELAARQGIFRHRSFRPHKC